VILIGLLFIAIQPKIGRFSMNPQRCWKALATSTFHSYSLILLMSKFTFLPALPTLILLAASLLGIARQLSNWRPVWRLTTQGNSDRLRDTFWLVIGPLIIYGWLIFSATQLRQRMGDARTELNIAVALIVLLITVLRNSWRLLVEIPSDQQPNDSGSDRLPPGAKVEALPALCS
jgi:hypothetical protein